MRHRLTVPLLLAMCLFTMISGVAEPAPADTTTLAEETILAPTEQTIEETTASAAEEDVYPTEWFVVDGPNHSLGTPAEETQEPPAVETEPPTTEQATQNGELISLGTFKLTAYCSCQKCCGKYALNRPVDENGDEIVYGFIGVRLEAGISIAVDPWVIPYGTQVIINGHTYTAHDTGGNIKGNRIDVYFDDHQEARDFGIQKAEVFIYG